MSGVQKTKMMHLLLQLPDPSCRKIFPLQSPHRLGTFPVSAPLQFHREKVKNIFCFGKTQSFMVKFKRVIVIDAG